MAHNKSAKPIRWSSEELLSWKTPLLRSSELATVLGLSPDQLNTLRGVHARPRRAARAIQPPKGAGKRGPAHRWSVLDAVRLHILSLVQERFEVTPKFRHGIYRFLSDDKVIAAYHTTGFPIRFWLVIDLAKKGSPIFEMQANDRPEIPEGGLALVLDLSVVVSSFVERLRLSGFETPTTGSSDLDPFVRALEHGVLRGDIEPDVAHQAVKWILAALRIAEEGSADEKAALTKDLRKMDRQIAERAATRRQHDAE